MALIKFPLAQFSGTAVLVTRFAMTSFLKFGITASVVSLVAEYKLVVNTKV